jgi:hypothetical protein
LRVGFPITSNKFSFGTIYTLVFWIILEFTIKKETDTLGNTNNKDKNRFNIL